MKNIAVLGGGSFGLALADLLARQGCNTRVWLRDTQAAEHLSTHRQHPTYLQGLSLHASITYSTHLPKVLEGSDMLWVAVPSSAIRSVLTESVQHTSPKPVVIGTKGIEQNTLFTMHEVACDALGPAWPQTHIMALSGPSFAKEIILQHPTAVVMAGSDDTLLQHTTRLVFCDSFRAYASNDIMGVELGGALKNVMAIAAGAITGLGFGDNTRAALITRGVAEMSRFAIAKGAQPLTLAGLAGMGDLILTCTGTLSRNRSLGQFLGQGVSYKEAVQRLGGVAEGVATAKAAFMMASQLNIHAPIIQAVHDVLFQNTPIKEALLHILRREPGREFT
jgi:glycerol-3-phosphate dehydrogenase (NAD(P)+)